MNRSAEDNSREAARICHPPDERSDVPWITAAICTRNRAGFLDRAIRSLLAQDLERHHYEILIVDNGSTDDTAAVCAAYAQDGVRYVAEPVPGLSRARNTALARARAPLIGYLDDDAEASPRWLSAACSCFRNLQPAPVWVGGPIFLAWPLPRPDWMDADAEEALGALNLGATPRWLCGDERLSGCNGCFSREALVAAGGFDIRLGRIGGMLLSGEETQLQRRMEARGWKLYYHPDVCMFHHVHPERVKQSFMYRRFYWGGVTDYFIRVTLADSGMKDVSLPQATPKEPVDLASRGGRVLRSALDATGIRGRVRAFRAIRYFCYVAGYLAAPWLVRRSREQGHGPWSTT